MSFTPPIFNVGFHFWMPGNTPAMGPADFGIPGQLYLGSRLVALVFFSTIYVGDPITTIRTPFDTFDTWGSTGPYVGGIWGYTDLDGINWYYRVIGWEYMHQGFPNVYLAWYSIQCDNTGAGPDSNR